MGKLTRSARASWGVASPGPCNNSRRSRFLMPTGLRDGTVPSQHSTTIPSMTCVPWSPFPSLARRRSSTTSNAGCCWQTASNRRLSLCSSRLGSRSGSTSPMEWYSAPTQPALGAGFDVRMAAAEVAALASDNPRLSTLNSNGSGLVPLGSSMVTRNLAPPVFFL